jgi:transposase-like protein
MRSVKLVRRTSTSYSAFAGFRFPPEVIVLAVRWQVIDVYVSAKRDTAAARAFFERAIVTTGTAPAEVVTDRAPVYPKLLDELWPKAWHHSEQYANNPIEADHGQLKRRLRPMRHLRNDRTATVVITGHAFVQNLRRGHYQLTMNVPASLRLAAAFDELAYAV